MQATSSLELVIKETQEHEHTFLKTHKMEIYSFSVKRKLLSEFSKPILSLESQHKQNDAKGNLEYGTLNLRSFCM